MTCTHRTPKPHDVTRTICRRRPLLPFAARRAVTAREGMSMDPINGRWFTRYDDVVEFDYYGRRIFRFHRCFPPPSFEHLDVLLAVSVAVAVVALSDSLRFDVGHIEMYLRPDDAFRLGPQLEDNVDWPKWSSKAAVVDGEPQGDAQLTVILVGH